jgi:hypothetical protein
MSDEKNHVQTCKECGGTLICARCAGRKGWNVQKGKVSHEQRVEWGRMGGRPPKEDEENLDYVMWITESR